MPPSLRERVQTCMASEILPRGIPGKLSIAARASVSAEYLGQEINSDETEEDEMPCIFVGHVNRRSEPVRRYHQCLINTNSGQP